MGSIARLTTQLLAPDRQIVDETPGPVRASPAGGTRLVARLDTALRVDRRSVETAVWTLANQRTGRVVTLVGTMHIGDRSYFRQLSEVVAEVVESGAEIHVEGISHGAVDDLSHWERERLAEAETWGNAETSGSAVAMLELESQGLRLRLPDNARNIDLSYGELLRRVGWKSYRRLLAPGPEMGTQVGFSPLVRAAIRFQLRHSQSLTRLRSLRPRNRHESRVVMDLRNEIAFAGGMEALERGDVALLWGTDHLPGLARLFAGAGYRPAGEEWFKACTI